MTSPVNMSAAVSHADVEEYMRVAGWDQQAPGYAGSMWTRNDSRIAVPQADSFDEPAAIGIVRRLAASEGRTAEEVAQDVYFVRSDVTNLRAANSSLFRETISLESAESMIGSARAMLRAVGTTALRARSHIRGNFSKIGDAVVNDARMAHTLRGSFVIPIIVPLSETFADVSRVPSLDLGVTRIRPEPFERRVTRTLAQSLRAVSEVLVEPAKLPTQKQVDATVDFGVSRELCSALESVVRRPDVTELETIFRWAPAFPAPTSDSNSRIVIDGGAAPILSQATKLLERSRVEAESILTGTIVEFRRATGDRRGQVSVATVRRGRPAEVQVSLSLDLYERAWLWHQEMRAVLVQGKVSSRRGRPLRIEWPTRFVPVDSETLFSAEDDEP